MALDSPPLAAKGEAERQGAGLPRAAPTEESERDRGRLLACAACRRPITTDAARIEIDGRHEHTFANPYGYAYRIGCFSTAVGLAGVGLPSAEFAWFVGHTWQIEQCAGCREHLGWLFRRQGRSFHGLILERLIEIEEPDAD